MPGTSASALLRTVWQDRGYPVDPVWIARKLGLRVVPADLDRDVSGALLKKPEEDPIIIINEKDSRSRQRFTCAHELGHYIKRTEEGELEYEFLDFRNKLSATGKDNEEVFANKFAAELLMPKKEVNRLRKEEKSPVEMAYYFDVSDDAMHFRLKGLEQLV